MSARRSERRAPVAQRHGRSARPLTQLLLLWLLSRMILPTPSTPRRGFWLRLPLKHRLPR